MTDRLPFLCIYRRRAQDNNTQSERLIMGEAAYLISDGNRLKQKQLAPLVKSVANTMKSIFGSFLIVEVWISAEKDIEGQISDTQPAFTIYAPGKTTISSTIETLSGKLARVTIRKQRALVNRINTSRIAPPGLPPMISSAETKQGGIHLIGIEIRPIFFNKLTGENFPLIRRELQHHFDRALKNTFFEFANHHTPLSPGHYHSLGRLSMVKAVWEVDRQLAEISNGFDFLLQVTPANSNSAWNMFKRKKFQQVPELIYRPLPLDPVLAKRRLYDIPIERIEDPGLAQLFRDQQVELDRKFTMLLDRGTPRFMYGSLQVYGTVEKSLLSLAVDLLEKLPARTHDEAVKDSIDANMFAARALKELAYFRESYPDIPSKVHIREDISGLMVSQGNLLISSNSKIPIHRVEALIQHEVGTHVLTYLNGKAQPFKQLYIGLPGYEELQEGLAVLAEYLVGGLTRPRLRLLAARVLAAHEMITGASFIDVFHLLNTVFYFERRTAFSITMRTFRGGGLTKDAVYLRGLVQLLKYLKNGGDIKRLYVGKIAVDHVPIIKELQWRNVLSPAPLRPRYLDDPSTIKKLINLKKGLSPMELITRRE